MEVCSKWQQSVKHTTRVTRGKKAEGGVFETKDRKSKTQIKWDSWVQTTYTPLHN